MVDDLHLKELPYFYGTEHYHRMSPMFKTVVTDGVYYVMQNGYSWFVTDALVIIEKKLVCSGELFLSVKLILGAPARLQITDGNTHKLHTQKYEFTDAKTNRDLFWCDGVLMLASEY